VTVVDEVRTQAAAHGDRFAVVDGAGRWTHAEFFARVDRLAHALIAAGLRQGDRVVCWLPNVHEALEAEWACLEAGGVWVTLNAGLTWPEVAIVVRDTEPAVFVTNAELMGRLDRDHGIAPWSFDRMALLAVGGLPSQGGPGFRASADFESALSAQPARRPDVSVTDADLARLRYTSGTTGRARAAMLSHGVYRASLRNLQNELHPLTPDDRVLHAAPLTHASAALSYPILAAGGACVLLPHFEPEIVLDAIERERITTFFAVPTMLNRLTAVPSFAKRDLHSIRTISYGGAPMPRARIEALVERFGPRLMQIYGLTEALHPVTCLQREEHRPGNPKLGSIGKPTRLCDVRIVDTSGEDVPEGKPGELWVKGPITMSGYWRNPEASAEVMHGDWIATGDVGYRDADGYLWLVDRSKDIIITGGFNVYPSEVEARLLAHPAVAEAAVFGLPHDDWGERVHAAVALEDGRTVTVAELIGFCRGALAGYKTPKGISVWPGPLPKNSSGKILKRSIIETLQQAAEVRG
jgi:acyl-CoA synthetase (AMP-forming)/AMP-acid ligase II